MFEITEEDQTSCHGRSQKAGQFEFTEFKLPRHANFKIEVVSTWKLTPLCTLSTNSNLMF